MVAVVVVAVVAVAVAASVAVASEAALAAASVAVADAGSDTCLYYYIEKLRRLLFGNLRSFFYFCKLSMICSITLGKCSISSRCSLWAMSSGVSSGESGVRNCAIISPPSQTLET